MKLKHVRAGKQMAVHNPMLFFANERDIAEEAWPGDIIGIPNHGTLRIGDTLTEIFNRSDRSGRPTGELANELAEERFKKHTAGAGQASERLARTG